MALPIQSEDIDIAQAIDELALQVMVKGAGAFRSKSAAAQLDPVSMKGHEQIASTLERLMKDAKAKTLSDDDARAGAAELQALLAAPVAAALPEAAPMLAFEDDPELLNDFVLEADEHLVAIEERILQLEKDPTLTDAIHAVFRSFHSIKGLAGFLGLSSVQAVAHEVETLLDHARNARVSVDSAIVDLVLEAAEYLKEEVAVVQARLNGTVLPPVRSNIALLASVQQANADVSSGRRATVVLMVESDACPGVEQPVPQEDDAPAQFAEDIAAIEIPETVSSGPSEQTVETSTPALTVPRKLSSAEGSAPLATQNTQAAPTEPVRADVAATSVRVETSKLDRLMDMVGEMVIAQSILSNLTRTSAAGESRLTGEVAHLARITSEVQRCAMSMRMMPIGPLFQKNAKLVRDLSRRSGKKVNLELVGEATELDKTIAEELADPLLHMIRNALDHGIESPRDRIAADKPETATLRITAQHEAGQIVVSIADDGRGLNAERIRTKALERGLIEENQHLTEQEIFHLIFAPGFSTAEKITDISGRGVGMDVVRQHVEHLRGRIEIESELGKGTTFYIHLPLTLAIIEGLVIVVGDHRYIIPLFSVREMTKPTAEMLFTVQGQDEMILMRGALLPLLRLHKRFAIPPRSEQITDGLLVVCEFGGKRFCLFVDDLLGRQEVVIKSLDEAFKNVRGLAGSAILGDGSIGLILDVAGIFSNASCEEVAA